MHCLGIDGTECTPVRPSSSQGFSQGRPVAFSPAYHEGRRYSQQPAGSSMRPLQSAPRHPSPGHMQMQQRQVLTQQKPARAIQRPLQFTASQAASQSLTPQSSQTQRSSQAHQYTQAAQGSQGLQVQDSQELMPTPGSQGMQTEGTLAVHTTPGMYAQHSQNLPSSQQMQGSQGMPQMPLTKPSQDTVAWSEETQADPPFALAAAQPYHHSTVQEGLLGSRHQSTHGNSAIIESAQTAGTCAAAAPASRLRMRMKSLAAATAINNAEAVNTEAPVTAANSRQQGSSALPSPAIPVSDYPADHRAEDQLDHPAGHLSDQDALPLLASPALGQTSHPEDHPAELPADQPADRPAEYSADQAADVPAKAAAQVAADAAKAAAEQVKQALAAAAAAQEECKTMAASAAAAATADKANQEARHAEVLTKTAGLQESCTMLWTALTSLQGSSDSQAAKLSAVESTCEALLGLMHGLSAQTQQAISAFQAQQVQQPVVTVLRCLESATQTSPVSLRHEAVQAQLPPLDTRLHPVSDKVANDC